MRFGPVVSEILGHLMRFTDNPGFIPETNFLNFYVGIGLQATGWIKKCKLYLLDGENVTNRQTIPMTC